MHACMHACRYAILIYTRVMHALKHKQVDKSRKRERIKQGLYPGDPDDLPIEAPMEMFNVIGSDFMNPDLVFVCFGLCLCLCLQTFSPTCKCTQTPSHSLSVLSRERAHTNRCRKTRPSNWPKKRKRRLQACRAALRAANLRQWQGIHLSVCYGEGENACRWVSGYNMSI